MKKYLLLLILLLIPLNVKANSLESINMDIYIDKYGNGHVVEVWNAYVTSGTEGYHPYYNLGNSYFSDFKVSDESEKKYTYIDNWNIKKSLSEKAYTNGFYSNGSEYDLCWGLSSYGHHTYKLEYKINNFIYNTSDGYQLLYWQLIPYEMSPTPRKFNITIHSDEAYSNTLPVWGYGNYGGLAIVEDGKIVLESPEDGLSSSDYMVVLVKFEGNTFNTDNSVDNTWDYYYELAEEGAIDYVNPEENASLFDIIWNVLFSMIIPFLFALLLVIIPVSITSRYTYKKQLGNKKDVSKANMFRDIPIKNDYPLVYLIVSEYNLLKKDSDYLGALILKWAKDKNINVSINDVDGKNEPVITLVSKPTTNDENEIKAYELLEKAAKNNVVSNTAFKNYLKKHYDKFYAWLDKCKKRSTESYRNSDYIIPNTESNLVNKQHAYLATDKLNELAEQTAGLKKFLQEFGDMKSKTAPEVTLWEDYLIYAQLFGIANNVIAEFKRLYPDLITVEEVQQVNWIVDYSTSSYNAASRARAQARAASYSSGGGGFSSGGGGGGSFGGGGGGGGFR